MVVAWEVKPGIDYLARDERGLFNWWWAGCYQSSEFVRLEDLVTASFLEQAWEIASKPPTHREVGAHGVEIGGYGEPFAMDFLNFEPLNQEG